MTTYYPPLADIIGVEMPGFLRSDDPDGNAGICPCGAEGRVSSFSVHYEGQPFPLCETHWERLWHWERDLKKAARIADCRAWVRENPKYADLLEANTFNEYGFPVCAECGWFVAFDVEDEDWNTCPADGSDCAGYYIGGNGAEWDDHFRELNGLPAWDTPMDAKPGPPAQIGFALA